MNMVLHGNTKRWEHPIKIAGKQLLISLVIPVAFLFSLLSVAQAASTPCDHCMVLLNKPISQYKDTASDTDQIEVGYILRKKDGSEKIELPFKKTKTDMVYELEKWQILATKAACNK
jgi:hypothetical protein